MSSTEAGVVELSPIERGVARIKPEYILAPWTAITEVRDDDALEAGAAQQSKRPLDPSPPVSDNGPHADNDAGLASKKLKLSGAQKKKLAREEDAKKRKERKGMNTGRKFARMRDEKQLCWKAATGKECTLSSCRFEHDILSYLSTKPPDICFPPSSTISNAPPFVQQPQERDGGATDEIEASESSGGDPATSCPVFIERGVCDQGFKCRFLGGHVRRSGDLLGLPKGSVTATPTLMVDPEKQASTGLSIVEMNVMSMDKIKAIRSRKYLTPKTDAYLEERALLDSNLGVDQEYPKVDDATGPATHLLTAPAKASGSVDLLAGAQAVLEESLVIEPTPALMMDALSTSDVVFSQHDTPDVPARLQEKKRLRWEGLNYLAPLTTVGNLPFRRLCVEYGAQITCGEMALTTSLLTGNRDEWSLIKRHPSESMFGVQLAGSRPEPLARIAEVFATELGPTGRGLGALGPHNGIDFVDVNCGCPIDMVFKSGAGSALLDNTARLGKILATMNRALGEIPLTIKVRTGVKDGRNTAHKLVPKLPGWSVGAVTVHGRTRQQRYTKLADWGYIKSCVDSLRAATTNAATSNGLEEDSPPIPIFGGGDVYTAQAYWENMEQSGVDGIMIGRGALIKPWIFTEINEHREWDISSKERLEMIRKYTEFGLSHWGSDTQGVNTTRRYLCESLSFQSRYIPLGILEVLPPKMNDRPPQFRGRDELETLLSSGHSRDWVKISEMFLGSPPDGWNFKPKHKSNAYGDEGNG
ncbi:tRNA-dihydrouridine synthase 3 [Tulasnella sp. JGI-2019a]|nr:tRNA-dihydrouridine synthase 3 [Tulasnella sp. JGI-2019a]